MSSKGEKDFIKHFALIGGGTFINMLMGLLTTPIITRIVDPVDYGQLSIFTMYSGIAVMILCLGLDQALVRFYYIKNTLEYKNALLYKCVWLPFVISLALAIIFLLFHKLGIIKFEFNFQLSFLLCVYIMVMLIYRFSLLLIRLEYNSKLYSGLSIARKVIYIIVAVPLIKIIGSNYTLLLVLATLTADGICMFMSVFAQRKTWNFTRLEIDACEIEQREMIKYGLPFIISLGITTLFQAIDKISLNKYCTYAEVGIYSSTMTLVNIFAIIQTTFNSLWAPMAVEHYTNNPEDKSFYQNVNKMITVVMFFVGISLILVKDVFAFLLGEKYREAAFILPFLVFNPIMYTISEVTVSGLVFKKKSKQQIIVAVGACITNIIGNTVLVPQLGCKGAAISTGLSYIVFFSLRTFLSNRFFKVNYDLKKFYLLTFFVVAYAFYNTFIKNILGSILGYLICILVLLILYKDTIVWMFKYGINYAKEIYNKRKI